jgi:hypothetical protein
LTFNVRGLRHELMQAVRLIQRTFCGVLQRPAALLCAPATLRPVSKPLLVQGTWTLPTKSDVYQTALAKLYAARVWATIPRAWYATSVDSDEKTLERLRERQAVLEGARVELNEADLEETFVKGGGPGGQKVNKTSSCVILRHTPTGIVIRCQAFRSQFQNRQEARRLLARKLDLQLRGEASQVSQEIARIRARKRKRQQRVMKKYFKSRSDQARLDS